MSNSQSFHDRIVTNIQFGVTPYALAVAAAALAAGANGALWPDFGLQYPLIVFYPAITISAWFGGFWPGIACTTLSSVIAAFIWLDPRFSTRISHSADAVALIAFFSVGLVISALCESLARESRRERGARHRAETAEENLATELADMQRLHALNATVLKEDELPRVLRDVLQASTQLLNADKGHVHLYEEVEDTLTIVAHIGLSRDFVDAFTIVPAGYSVCGEAVVRRQPVNVENTAHDSAFAPLAAMYASHGVVAVQSVPLIGRDGKVLGVLSTFFGQPRRPTDRELRFLDLYAHQAERAIERHRLLEAERLARRGAEQANRLKDLFLSTVSHELRTPLNAVLGWADMLRSGRLAGARRDRALQAVYDNAQRQVQLIGDLLDVSRIMAGTLRLEQTAVDLRAVVQCALEVIEPAAHAKAIDLVVDHDPNAITLYGDATRLQQVAWNLLSNAVKFTPIGGTVYVNVRRREHVVEIVVRDTGPGIPRDFLPLVFEPFRQADASTTRSHGGLGLGLSIVRHLVEAHGGGVQAASEGEGEGAVFTVRLPVVAVPVDPGETHASTGRGHPLPSVASLLLGISVLVVDDDADSRDVISAALEEAGAAVIVAASTAEALDCLQQHTVNLLLADIAMPGEDGYSLIHKVRMLKSPAIAGVPAVALTSMARDQDRRQAVNAGFQLHIPKPVDAHSLARALANLLHHQVGTSAGAPPIL